MGLVEVLVTVVILSVALIPVLSLSSQGIETTRVERARRVARLIGANILEWMGSARRVSELRDSLRPAGSPNVLESGDLLALPGVGAQVADMAWADVVAAHRMQASVALHLRVLPRAHLLECRVRWTSERSRARRTEEISLARLLVDGGP